MSNSSPNNVSLHDPLSEVTRKERRMLLGISVLSIFIVNTGLVPTKISALGISLDGADQQAFYVVMAFVVGYFLAAFILYGLSDFVSWRLAYNESLKINYQKFFDSLWQKESKKISDNLDSEGWVSTWPNSLAHPVSYARALFEFLLPILLGGYAIYGLVCAATLSAA